MADYDSSLPIRSEADGADERVQVKIVDKANPDTQQMTVDSDGNSHVEAHGNDPTNSDTVIRTSEQGHPSIDGKYDVSENTDPSNMGIIAHERNVNPADVHQVKRVTAKTGTNDTDVHALDISLHDYKGDRYDSVNPLPVKQVTATIGDPVFDPQESSAVAKDSSVTHTYTVSANKKMVSTQFMVSASGRVKVEVKHGTPGSTQKVYTDFNSTACPKVFHKFGEDFFVPENGVFEIVITNLDNQAMDVYSLLEGEEIDL